MEDRYGFKPEFSSSTPYQNPATLSYPQSHIFPPLSDTSLPHPNPGSHVYPPLSDTSLPNPNLGSYVYPPLSDTSLPNPNPGSHVYPPLSNSSTPYPNVSPQPQRSYNNQAYRWVDSAPTYGSIPPTAVQGGVDADGHPIYVGRAYHDGDLIPAKVIPGKNAAYVAHNGAEHLVESYQVLCKQFFDWVPTHAGHVPPGAVQGGHTGNGEILFIGRAVHEGSQTIGKVHPSHGVCYIPFNGEEVACPDYETLVLRM